MLSRVADALYWLGRYVERSENLTRILLVTDDISTEAQGLDESLAQAAWKDLLAIFPAAQLTRDTPPYAPLALPYLLAFFADPRNHYSVSYCLRRARENARAVREALTLEVFVSLNETHHALEKWERKPPGDVPGLRDALTDTHRGVFSIVGAIAHTLPRDEGWKFLRLGEAIERLYRSACVLRVKLPALLGPAPVGDVPLHHAQWRTLLRSLASLEHFRRTYGARLEPDAVVPFLVLEAESPRSLRHGADTVERYVAALAGPQDSVTRLVGRLASELRYADAGTVGADGVTGFLDSVVDQTAKIHDAIDARFFVT
ncbi:MAG: alpha-E domain-containing protein [Candidatus Rokubacteria bacterium]|nr:alpha-E domain-containing protein [Candidatus Rokubacteria bacterium]